MISRRKFLAGAAAAAAMSMVGCQPAATQPATPPTVTGRPRVAIARAADYDRALIQQQVRDMLDRLGGLGDVIRPGDKVAIKINMTGGVKSGQLPGVSPIDSFITHPEVVRALSGLVRDAGAKALYIVEAAYEWDSFRDWGYEEVAQDLGATLIDLNDTQPYADFVKIPVGEGWFIYRDFTFNRILNEVDRFISVSKIKCHWCCGVTHTIKNLVGLVPFRFYSLKKEDGYRSAFHGEGDAFATRLPRVIMDLVRARPIHFALAEGVKTTEGGEGPWIKTMAAVEAGVLVAGKNALATDAVATAVMGFDPTAERTTSPFLRADNHLNLARQLGLGTNRLDEIDVVGATIDEVRRPFKPCLDE